MNLVVFGANGPTGRQVVHQVLAVGRFLTAEIQKLDEFPFSSGHLDVVTVDRALAGAQAVVSTIGVPNGRSEITVDLQAITSITKLTAGRRVDRRV